MFTLGSESAAADTLPMIRAGSNKVEKRCITNDTTRMIDSVRQTLKGILGG